MNHKAEKLIVATIVLSLTGAAYAVERHISRSELPPAVQKTAEQQSKGSTVRGYTTDTEDGRLEYEVEMTTNGHSKDVTIAPDGTLLEIEEQVMLETLPSEVRTGLQNKAGQGKITKVESLTKHGSLVAYEAQVMTGGKHSEIQVGPGGKPLDHEE